MQAAPAISVILATRDRKTALERFLNALRMLAGGPLWELVVVDNGSTDGTDELLSTASKTLPITRLSEEQPGKSRALNRGLAEAKGGLLLFTDDDVVPEPHWLTALHDAAVVFPDANVFGGRIVADQERMPGWVARSYNLKTMLASEQDLGHRVCRFAENQYPVGPNLAVRRKLLERGCARWPVHLGPGTKIPLGDERAFLMPLSPPSVRDRLYVPTSVVRHEISGRRLSIGGAIVRCFLGGFSAGLVSRRYGAPGHQRCPNVWSLARERARQSSSLPELACMASRALGLIAGTVTPFSRLV